MSGSPLQFGVVVTVDDVTVVSVDVVLLAVVVSVAVVAVAEVVVTVDVNGHVPHIAGHVLRVRSRSNANASSSQYAARYPLSFPHAAGSATLLQTG